MQDLLSTFRKPGCIFRYITSIFCVADAEGCHVANEVVPDFPFVKEFFKNHIQTVGFELYFAKQALPVQPL